MASVRLASYIAVLLFAVGCQFDASGVPTERPDASDQPPGPDAPLPPLPIDAMPGSEPDAAPNIEPDAALPDAQPGPDAYVPACMRNGEYTEFPTNGHRYRRSGDTSPGDDARSLCENEDAYLIVINDAAENEHARSIAGGDALWIGLTDEDEEGTFVWVNGNSLGYSNWKGNEPNGGDSDDCVEMLGGGPDVGKWNDRRCRDGRAFICECDPSYVPRRP